MRCHLIRLGLALSGLRGHLDIVRQCREWGAININGAVRAAAGCGYLELVRHCLEWGSTEIDVATAMTLIENHDKLVQLCLDWAVLHSDPKSDSD